MEAALSRAVPNTDGRLNDGIRHGQDGFILPVDVAGDGIAVNTGVAMVNVNPTNRITLVLVLMPENGSSSATGIYERFMTLDPGHHITDFVTSIWPQLAVGFRGTLSVAVVDFGLQDSLVLTALSVKEGLLSALPVIPDNSCRGCWDY